ncbi:MAG TPA: OB-fold domain-containing protein [Dehalococcoidia bacterium]|nr:OB-fold domain-containing protein [Dehalococcoidia bacterium]
MSSPGADLPYWTALAQGVLKLPRCGGCSRWQWPAVWRCGECSSWEQEWQQVEPRGTVYSWTRTCHPFASEDLPPPYVTLLVELPQAGKIRLLGLLDPAEAKPWIGAAVVGAPGATRIGGRDIPALRWRLDG